MYIVVYRSAVNKYVERQSVSNVIKSLQRENRGTKREPRCVQCTVRTSVARPPAPDSILSPLGCGLNGSFLSIRPVHPLGRGVLKQPGKRVSSLPYSPSPTARLTLRLRHNLRLV